MDGLFADAPAAAFPPDTLCAQEFNSFATICGHRNDQHVNGVCSGCTGNRARGFNVEPAHEFIPRKLAGGALNPTQEREAYERSLKEGRA